MFAESGVIIGVATPVLEGEGAGLHGVLTRLNFESLMLNLMSGFRPFAAAAARDDSKRKQFDLRAP